MDKPTFRKNTDRITKMALRRNPQDSRPTKQHLETFNTPRSKVGK